MRTCAIGSVKDSCRCVWRLAGVYIDVEVAIVAPEPSPQIFVVISCVSLYDIDILSQNLEALISLQKYF